MIIKKYFLPTLMVLSLMVPTINLPVGRSMKKPFWMPALEYVNQSRLACLFEKHIQAKILSGSIFGTELSSEKYQALAKEAQTNVGIPEEFHGPAYKISENIKALVPFLNNAGGLALPDSILINEERLDRMAYGYQRFALYHEAVHKKNNDSSFDTITELGTLITSGILCHHGLKWLNPKGKSKLLHAMGIIVPSIISMYVVNSTYKKMYERRADIEGLYATNCAQCASEAAECRKYMFETENNPLAHNGYLWPNEIKAIAQDLESQGKVCAHHKEKAQTISKDKLEVTE